MNEDFFDVVQLLMLLNDAEIPSEEGIKAAKKIEKAAIFMSIDEVANNNNWLCFLQFQ